MSADLIRDELGFLAKDFKTSWTRLGRALYPVWKDKLFYGWGYEKFEHFTERELGIKKPAAMRLLKAYFFIEQEEPQYLAESFVEKNQPAQVPSCDAVNVLRLARQRKELNRDDYRQLRSAVFEKGKDATAVRRDLTTLMKERKFVDPEEEREKRHEQALKRVINALKIFEKDMEALKLIKGDLVEEAKGLAKKLEGEL